METKKMRTENPTPSNPHPMIVFSGNVSHELAKRIAQYADCPMGDAKTKPFANGECMVQISNNVRSRDVFVVQSLCRLWSTTADNPYTGINDALMELLVWGDTLSRASTYRTTAVIPSFAYARQDRKAASRTPVTARLVCDMIQTAGFDRVLTMDLHSDQIQGFFDRKRCQMDHLSAGPLFARHFEGVKNAVVLSPDVGNLKKADKYRKGLPDGVGIAVIDKRRCPVTGRVTSERITGDSIENKTVIILDDILSTAGTIRSAIDLADAHGAKEFRIGVTHGEFVGPAIERLSHKKIVEIAVTDTIPLLDEIARKLPIKILSTSDLFGEAIRRIHLGESISELLGDYG